MKVLVLAALAEATGNNTIGRRIAGRLGGVHEVLLRDTLTSTPEELRALARDEKVDLALGLHALLAGPFLRATGLPYALIFGGTDLYEPMHDLHQKAMARAVTGAARLVAFSPENRARAEWMWPSIRGRVDLVPQAVEVPRTADPTAPSLRSSLGLGAGAVLVLLPTGIRRVKDPLHAVRAFSALHARDPRMHLVLAGAVLEPDYAEDALPVLRSLPGVHYVDALSRAHMLAAMAEADVVVNTSLSEGMCSTILEAMALGTPVVARRNAGNESLVVHGHTGLLYDEPEEMTLWVHAIVNSPDLRVHLTRTARRRIELVHTPQLERDRYAVLLEAQHASPTRVAQSERAVDELSVILPSAERLGLDAGTLDALRRLLLWLEDDAAQARVVRECAALVGTAPPGVALTELRARELEGSLGPERARLLLLALALLQVPAFLGRTEARGVSEAIAMATLADLREWSAHTARYTGSPGLSLELLEWSLRYLRGELFRVGAMQFELQPFSYPMRVYRHRRTRRLSGVTLENERVDLVTGRLTHEHGARHDAGEWDLSVEPGSPMLKMWIPGASGFVSLFEVGRSIREAYGLFARMAPETIPLGIYGESWRLDPQVLTIVPEAPSVQDLQRACCLFPTALEEARTVKRLFGPDATRESAVALDRAALDPVRAAVAAFLEDPTHRLEARGGFALREELEQAAQW